MERLRLEILPKKLQTSGAFCAKASSTRGRKQIVIPLLTSMSPQPQKPLLLLRPTLLPQVPQPQTSHSARDPIDAGITNGINHDLLSRTNLVPPNSRAPTLPPSPPAPGPPCC